MIDSEIQCLKDNVGKLVEIETTVGEWLIAKVLCVEHDEEYDEHNLLYEMVASTKPEFYGRHADAGGFALDFDKIVSVKPHAP